MEYLFSKPLAVAVIILFLGLAIQPSVAVQQETKMEVEGKIAQIKNVINEILERYGYHFMVSFLCKLILGLIELFITMVVCSLYLIIILPIIALIILLSKIFYNYSWEIIYYAIQIFGDWLDYCTEWPYKLNLPFQLIYNLSNTQNITNLIEDCPCLQE